MAGTGTLPDLRDTIVAVATPHGTSGIGVVRISGGRAHDITAVHLSPVVRSLPSWRAICRAWCDSRGEVIDQCLVTFYRGPRSYTGDDVVEVSAHGNPVVLQRIVQSVLADGARLARPGEFTLRAVVNGKMDLLQAEAVRDFIASQTEDQARRAIRQVTGEMSRLVRPERERLLSLVAELEGAVDFPDDVSDSDWQSARDRVRVSKSAIEALANSYGVGRVLRDGVRVALIGRPNVGKSSLFNRLLGQDRAIVTEVPGTTRDVVTAAISVKGVPFSLLDTAGVRDNAERVEAMGISRTWEAAADADLLLVILDGSSELTSDDATLLERSRGLRRMMVVNKSDLERRLEVDRLEDGTGPVASVSASTGEGVQDLLKGMLTVAVGAREMGESAIVTSERQAGILSRAANSLSLAEGLIETHAPTEIVLIELRQALAAVGELSGEVSTEDILGRIFDTFCIGK